MVVLEGGPIFASLYQCKVINILQAGKYKGNLFQIFNYYDKASFVGVLEIEIFVQVYKYTINEKHTFSQHWYSFSYNLQQQIEHTNLQNKSPEKQDQQRHDWKKVM